METNMKNVKRTWAILFAGAGLLLGSALAKADTLTLSEPYQIGGPGEVLDFDATFTNTTSSIVYLNADSFNVDMPLTLDDTAFQTTFAYDPSTGDYDVGPGHSYTGLLFTVTIPPGTPFALYAGDFEILGGGPSDTTDVIGAADFNVQVTPEPTSLLLLASGLAGLLTTIRLRKA